MKSARRSRVHRSLIEPQLIAGVEKPFAVVNFTLAVVFVAELHLWFYLPIGVGAHLVLRHLTRRDPFTRAAYIRYNRQADAYDPWPHARMRRGTRPPGWGRGVLC